MRTQQTPEEARHYFVVEFSNGTTFFISPEAAGQLDRDFTEGIVEVLRFQDCSGSLCIMPRSDFHGLWESTAAQRAWGREHAKVNEAEAGTIPGLS